MPYCYPASWRVETTLHPTPATSDASNPAGSAAHDGVWAMLLQLIADTISDDMVPAASIQPAQRDVTRRPV